MKKAEAINCLEMFLYKQCDLERTASAYDANTIWDAVKMATDALVEAEPVGSYDRGYIEGYTKAESDIFHGGE